MLVKLKVLKSIVFQYVMGDCLILIYLIDELLKRNLVVVLLFEVEDDSTADERS